MREYLDSNGAMQMAPADPSACAQGGEAGPGIVDLLPAFRVIPAGRGLPSALAHGPTGTAPCASAWMRTAGLISRFDLGHLGGVPLGFTDAAALPGS